MQLISASDGDGEKGCPLQQGNEEVIASTPPSANDVNNTLDDDTNDEFAREAGDERNEGDESGDDECVFHRGDERDYESDRDLGPDDVDQVAPVPRDVDSEEDNPDDDVPLARLQRRQKKGKNHMEWQHADVEFELHDFEGPENGKVNRDDAAQRRASNSNLPFPPIVYWQLFFTSAMLDPNLRTQLTERMVVKRSAQAPLRRKNRGSTVTATHPSAATRCSCAHSRWACAASVTGMATRRCEEVYTIAGNVKCIFIQIASPLGTTASESLRPAEQPNE